MRLPFSLTTSSVRCIPTYNSGGATLTLQYILGAKPDRSGARVAGLLLACTFLIAGCYTGPGPDHFVAILDELVVPADWQVVQTVTRGPGEERECDPSFSTQCPTAIRWFTLSDGLVQGYAQAKEVVANAGFAIGEEAPEPCSDAVSRGNFCGFWASRGPDTLMVTVFHALSETEAQGGDQSAPAVGVSAYRRP